MESELHLEVGKAVIRRHPVVMDSVIFFCHRNHIYRNLNDVWNGDYHTVSGRNPLHFDALVLRVLYGERAYGDYYVFPIVSKLKMVDFVVPCYCLGGLDGEDVGVEEDAQGLNPCEVTRSAGGAVAGEPGVDLEVAVGDKAEMLVALSVEVEYNAVSADETRIVAHCTRAIAVWLTICTQHWDIYYTRFHQYKQIIT